MSIGKAVDIRDTATPALKAKLAKCDPARVNVFVGEAGVLLTQKHLLRLPSNQRGFPSTNFYKRAAAATHYTRTEDGVVISISQIGMRQRFQGGPIRPVNAKALAFPIDAESYGKVPADFGERLQLIVIKGKGAYLALKPSDDAPKKGKRKKKGEVDGVKAKLKFLFMLSAGVDQAANPGVIPTNEEYIATALEAAGEATR